MCHRKRIIKFCLRKYEKDNHKIIKISTLFWTSGRNRSSIFFNEFIFSWSTIIFSGYFKRRFRISLKCVRLSSIYPTSYESGWVFDLSQSLFPNSTIPEIIFACQSWINISQNYFQKYCYSFYYDVTYFFWYVDLV